MGIGGSEGKRDLLLPEPWCSGEDGEVDVNETLVPAPENKELAEKKKEEEEEEEELD